MFTPGTAADGTNEPHMQAVTAADKAGLASLRQYFREIGLNEIGRMRGGLDALRRAGDAGEPVDVRIAAAEIKSLADDLVAQFGFFQAMFVVRLAGSLSHYLEEMSGNAVQLATVIQCHIDALDFALTSDRMDDGGEAGSQIMAQIKRLRVG